METTTFARLVVCKSERIFLLRRKAKAIAAVAVEERRKKKNSRGSRGLRVINQVVTPGHVYKTGSRGIRLMLLLLLLFITKADTSSHKWFHLNTLNSSSSIRKTNFPSVPLIMYAKAAIYSNQNVSHEGARRDIWTDRRRTFNHSNTKKNSLHNENAWLGYNNCNKKRFGFASLIIYGVIPVPAGFSNAVIKALLCQRISIIIIQDSLQWRT